MKQTIERILLVAVLIVGLACAWAAPIDDEATKVVDRGLTRALITFASARALNAGLSLVQSTTVGLGASISPGQLVYPLNELVGQFAELMLAASVSFGLMKILIVIGSSKAISLLLTLVTLAWGWMLWQGKLRPSWLSKTLLVFVLIRFAVPVASMGSEVVFNQVLADTYAAAQSGIDGGKNKWETFKGWVSPTTDFSGRFKSIEQSAENWVKHIIDLIVLFLLQTLVLPLFLIWILYRIGLAVLNPIRQTSQSSRRTEIAKAA